MIFEEKRVNTKKVYDGAILNVRQDTVTAPKGHAYREIVEHNGAVAAVVLTDDGKIVMVRQYRYACGRVVLEVPAGKIDRGETDPEAAMIRELKEETGYTAKRIKKLTSFYPSTAFSNEELIIYIAKDLVPGKQNPDDDEFIERVTVPFKQALQMIKQGKIKDAKTVIALLYVASKI